jgi:hypothetical protein
MQIGTEMITRDFFPITLERDLVIRLGYRLGVRKLSRHGGQGPP